MGHDKALLEVDGRPLAGIASDALAGAGAAEVLIIGGDRATLEPFGTRFVDDGWPGEGPLGGVVTALRAAVHDPVVVLACDLPHIVPAAVTAVLHALGDADAAIPDVDGRRQVLVAAYRRACREPLEAALMAGERALRHATRQLHVATVDLTDRGWVLNVNRPADLEPGGGLGAT
jgi:molybdopterin-guanine dinucleotide biosynthesis protein A